VKPSSLQTVSVILAGLAVVAGVVGMPASFTYLASRHDQDVLAGVAGFIAGAVLAGSGIVSMAILASRGSDVPSSSPNPSAPLSLAPDDDWRMKSAR
jgi:hypothetical protein